MSARYYYSVDEQGSTDFIADINGNVKNEYWYDAFGNVLDSREEVHNRITYTGQQFDGITQQYYLRARFYNPVIGRFTQEDVYRGDGLNLYAYCGNNPVRYWDPSGYVKKRKTCPIGGNKERQINEKDNSGNRPPNLSPKNAGRRGAFREAKRKNGIPVGEQPKSILPNVDKRGNPQPGKIYEFENGIRIRDDSKGHEFPDDPSQNRGPHFNDPDGNHYDY